MREIQFDAKTLVADEARLGALSASLRLAAVVVLAVTLGGCMGYVPGRQSYWDAKVKEMCEKDGGVRVFERIRLSARELEAMRQGQGLLVPFENESLARGLPYVRRSSRTIVNESNPEVGRLETYVVRRSDQKILGQSVHYWWRGGDFPTGITEASSFSCPSKVDLVGEIFLLDGGTR